MRRNQSHFNKGNGGSCIDVKEDGHFKSINRFRLESRIRMGGAVLPLKHIPSWSAQADI